MKKNDIKIKYDDLCYLISDKMPHGNTSVKSVKRYLKAIYEVILEQLEINDEVYIKNFGTFYVKDRKSGTRKINNPVTNEMQLVYVEPQISISFKPSKTFIYAVNNEFKLTCATERKAQQEINKKKNSKIKRVKNIADLMNVANSRKGINNGKANDIKDN